MLGGDMTDSNPKPHIVFVATLAVRQPLCLQFITIEKPIDTAPAADASGLLEQAVSAMLRPNFSAHPQLSLAGALSIRP